MQPLKIAKHFSNKALGFFETDIYCRLTGQTYPKYPPIFIIGAPRSGTTLFYQLLVQARAYGYISNWHCARHAAPGLWHSFTGWRPGKTSGDFASSGGRTKSPDGPSECGAFWYRFFPRNPHSAGRGAIPHGRLRQMTASVAALTQACDAPVIFKNVINSVRMAALDEAFPDCLFIEVRRDPERNAQSILAQRKLENGTYDDWWSVRPAGLTVSDQDDPVRQVFEQIEAVRKSVAADASTLPDERFLSVQYEDFLEDTAATLARVDAFVARHTMLPATRGQVPPSFPETKAPALPDALQTEIAAVCNSPAHVPERST
ncbi:sulfotransferase family protein [Hwanghaeella grinnelliae]|uniref:sulfotransferase family protein n=1 Tax=Hwanghaeella grinnelliae TaxID=2500179 RepID=UPI001386652A|nr:sulfotransferase [Hwanghaeella grinnelliae]